MFKNNPTFSRNIKDDKGLEICISTLKTYISQSNVANVSNNQIKRNLINQKASNAETINNFQNLVSK